MSKLLLLIYGGNMKNNLRDYMILNLTRKQISANGAKNRTHKLRLIWNSLSWSKEIPRQKCIVMAISCRDRYLYIFAYIMYMIWYIYIILVVIFWDLSNVCFLSPHSSSLQMLSGVRLTPNFSKCYRKEGNNTVLHQNF